MAFGDYHSSFQIIANSTTYTFPVASLAITAIPWHGSKETSKELFDGRMVQRISGWRHHIKAEWGELAQSEHDALRNAILDLITAGSGVLRADVTGPKDITVVLADASSALQAVFNRKIRDRGASISLVETSIQSVPNTWLTS